MDTSDISIFFGGWIIIIFMLYTFSRIEGTKTILYYVLWLGVVLDVVTHGTEIKIILEKFKIATPTQGPTTPIPNPVPSGGVRVL